MPIFSASFVLGDGYSGTAGDIEMVIESSQGTEVKWSASADHPYREQIESQVRNWLEVYSGDVSWLVNITRANVDPVRQNDFPRALNLAFRDALKSHGVEPPQIFASPEKQS